jgi:LmbE family N-acetylglucosaminyl deacetylase
MRPAGDPVLTMATVRAAFAAAPVVSSRDLTRHRPVLILAPHADDETLGCGGLIIQLARAGVPLAVALLTDGARSHVGSREFPAYRLRKIRETELRTALGRLGVSTVDILFFREPDGFLGEVSHHEIFRRLGAFVASHGIETVFVTWAADPHPDHQAAAAIATELATANPDLAIYAYPIWGLRLSDDVVISADVQQPVRLDVAADRAMKVNAVAAHASQTTDMINDCPEPFRLSARDIALFTGPHEIFIPMTSAAATAVARAERHKVAP